MVTAGLGIGIPRQHHLPNGMVQRLENDVMVLSKAALENNAALVIIDSAAPAAGEPEAAAPTTAYFSALRGIGTSTLTVAHVSKGGMSGNQAFGSIFWRNLPRINFKAISERTIDGDLIIGLRNTKMNNGRRVDDLAWKLAFDRTESVTFSKAGYSLHG